MSPRRPRCLTPLKPVFCPLEAHFPESSLVGGREQNRKSLWTGPGLSAASPPLASTEGRVDARLSICGLQRICHVDVPPPTCTLVFMGGATFQHVEHLAGGTWTALIHVVTGFRSLGSHWTIGDLMERRSSSCSRSESRTFWFVGPGPAHVWTSTGFHQVNVVHLVLPSVTCGEHQVMFFPRPVVHLFLWSESAPPDHR